MNNSQIEYAGGITLEQTSTSRRGILSRAPAWWRQLAERGSVTGSNPRAPSSPGTAKPAARARSLPAVIGWIAGTCCPGVSRPAYGAHDRETLPEQFTPRAWNAILAQVRSGKPVPVTWGHDGPTIASTGNIDVLFRVDPTCGLEFEVRLRDSELGRKVLAEIDGRSLGVSIGFTKTDSWTVDRDGVGRMRVVDGCVLHHVAILPRSATLKPAYSGARCYGARDNGIGCPTVLYRDAEAWAFRFITRDARALT